MAHKEVKMFGWHELPAEIPIGGERLAFETLDSHWLYKRIKDDKETERMILTEKIECFLAPVEPLLTPKELTSLLLLEFESPLWLEPRKDKRIFVSAPLEVGVYVGNRHSLRSLDLLDVISCSKQKFTLYGQVHDGMICKYFNTPVWVQEPESETPDRMLVELLLQNRTGTWVQVTQTLLSAFHMTIFFGQQSAMMRATMTITQEGLAETQMSDSPLYKDTQKAIQQFRTRRLPGISQKFVMEWGI
ncbi:DUF432 domain-containing protein [candidate division KSB1 bacterium]|nr:DUF432 domain-containing protein [candidate division KSB1 bacterium]